MSLFWSPKLLRFGKEHERLRQRPVSLVPGTVGCLLAIAISLVTVGPATAQSLAAWGNNSAGQFGNGTTSPSGTANSIPVAVPNNNGVLAGKKLVQIVGGYTHSLALCSDGTVAAWGNNQYGQLGNNSDTSQTSPVAVVTNSGALQNKRVIQLAAGYQHVLALCSDGTLAAWGWNGGGQLGNGTRGSGAFSSTPVSVTTSGTPLAGKTIVQITAGYAHSVALCSDGTLATWGYNKYGELGNGSSSTTVFSTTPAAVVTSSGALQNKKVVQVAAGREHCLVLCSDNTLAAWGWNAGGQLGNGASGADVFSSTPVSVTTSGTPLAGKTIVQIAGGSAHSLALCSDGTVAGWGYNNQGQLGDGTTTLKTTPVSVVNSSGALQNKKVVQVVANNADAGFNHSLALCSDGTIAAWGYNNNGQLGDGTMSSSSTPVAVVTSSGALQNKKVTQLGSGAAHSLALADVAQTVATTGTAPSVIISEFRLGTSAAPTDEYIELYNASGTALNLSGYSVYAGFLNPGTLVYTFPANTTIPARGHYLLTGAAYSLGSVASSNSALSGDLPINGGIAILNPSGQIVDQAGVAGYLEGSALPTPPASGEYAYVRRVLPTSPNGAPADSNDNASDFMLVSTSSTSQVAAPRLGAPGPENLASPIQTNGIISQSLVCQHRIGTGNSGSLTVRRRLTNTSTSLYITGLRLRLNDVSAGTGKTADVRPVGGNGTTAPGRTLSNGTVAPSVPATGRFVSLLLGAPSTSTGGANSVLVPPSTFFSTFSLAPGASIDVEYTLNVVTSASYALSINFETTTSSSPSQPA